MGRVDAVLEDGRVRVLVGGAGVEVMVAWPLVSVTGEHVGRRAAVLPKGKQAVLIGLVAERDLRSGPGASSDVAPAVPREAGSVERRPPQAVVDGKRVELTAADQIVLRCGKASITLTRAGKILVKGEYVLTEAKSVNRLRGGVVHIN